VRIDLKIKQRKRGFDEATYIESFLVLNAVGGDCLEDFDQSREDAGLAEMLGRPIPSAEAARKFLYQFHDEAKIEQARVHLVASARALLSGGGAAHPAPRLSSVVEGSPRLRHLPRVP
jgi:hypothetical protein